jgi:hypothetical protein
MIAYLKSSAVATKGDVDAALGDMQDALGRRLSTSITLSVVSIVVSVATLILRHLDRRSSDRALAAQDATLRASLDAKLAPFLRALELKWLAEVKVELVEDPSTHKVHIQISAPDYLLPAASDFEIFSMRAKGVQVLQLLCKRADVVWPLAVRKGWMIRDHTNWAFSVGESPANPGHLVGVFEFPHALERFEVPR